MMNPNVYDIVVSRPAWDAWIEMESLSERSGHYIRRVPHGTRGLKFSLRLDRQHLFKSRPAWDAWIEINIKVYNHSDPIRRVPHGTRGLKFNLNLVNSFSRHVASRMGRVD